MKTFGSLAHEERQKIYLIHFNHTNPLLGDDELQTGVVQEFGFKITKTEMVLEL